MDEALMLTSLHLPAITLILPRGKLRLRAVQRFSQSLSADVALSPSTPASPLEV